MLRVCVCVRTRERFVTRLIDILVDLDPFLKVKFKPTMRKSDFD